MKALKAIIAVCALLCIPAIAQAAPVTGQISVGGYAAPVGSAGFGSATGVNFANGSGNTISGTSGGLYSFGASTGSFTGLSCASTDGTCGAIKDIASFATEPATSAFITLTTGGPSISFDLSSITSVSENASFNFLSFTAMGIINYTGYDATAGTFTFTGQGVGTNSFSGSVLITAVPEPASLAILGGGLLGLAGFAGMRRRKSKVA